MRFRTKPAEVEAFQYDGDFQDCNGWYVPQWAIDANKAGILYFDELNGVPAELFVKTPAGARHVALDDYVIKGADGNLYPCNRAVFEATYEQN